MGVFFFSMSTERTFLAIKPDGVQRNLVGEIVGRFERKGFQLVGMKFMQVPKELAEKHYEEHKERPFFQGLIDFITSGPVVAMVWQGTNVVAGARSMIHGSDAVETAQREISLWFNDNELADWTPRSN